MEGKEERGFKERMKQDISRARVFVDRYSKDSYGRSDDLAGYVRKYEEKTRPVVAGAICLRLIEHVSLKNHKRLLKGLGSIKEYIGSERIEEIQETIGGVCEEYEWKKVNSYMELKIKLGAFLKDGLKRQGISGSAIEANVGKSSQWKDLLYNLDTTYNKLLDHAKGEPGTRMKP